MIIHTDEKEIKEYYSKDDCISASLLKKYLKPTKKSESDLYFQESEIMNLGTLVDFIFTHNQEDFDKYFYISNINKKPSDAIKSICHYCFDNNIEIKKEFDKDNSENQILLKYCRDIEYHSNYKDDTLLTKVSNEGFEYYNELINLKDRVLITKEDYDRAVEISKQIFNDLNTFELFQEFYKDSTEIKAQKPIYFHYDDVKCKALPDFINYNDGHISIYDLKITSYGIYDFYIPYNKLRYDIQASFYKQAVISTTKNIKSLSFYFIVHSTQDNRTVLIRDQNDFMAMFGGDVNGKNLVGWVSAFTNINKKVLTGSDPFFDFDTDKFFKIDYSKIWK